MGEIGLYIHIPYCKSKCLYCDFNSYVNPKTTASIYIEGLISELLIYLGKNEYKVATVFIGGGTPTYIDKKYIGQIMDTINKYIIKDAEVTIECNPGTVDDEALRFYKEKGINRLSIGLQAWQNGLLASVGRIHDTATFVDCYKMARKAGFNNISVDIMFAIPGQTMEMWLETVENVCELQPEHISCYSLKLEEGTPMYDMNEKGVITSISEELDRDMYHNGIAVMKKFGYNQYEISNFSKPNFESRHNLIYWQNKEYIGVGAGSHSKLYDKRFWNYKSLEKYTDEIKAGRLAIEDFEIITTEIDMWETIILGLRLNIGVSVHEFETKYAVNFNKKYGNIVEALVSKGLIERLDDCIVLTDLGRDLSNVVFVEFM